MVPKRALGLLSVLILTSACWCPWTVGRTISNLTEQGSGTLVTREYDLTDLAELVIRSAFQAKISRADSFRVSVTIDDNLERYVKVEKRGTLLDVGIDGVVPIHRATLEVTITLPDLHSLDVSGASTVEMTGIVSPSRFDLTVSGASKVLGDLEAPGCKLRVSGASTVTLKGQGGDADIEVSGASRARLEDLTLADARVKATGASSAHVTLSGRLDASASSASIITYGGNPTLGTISESGASSIQQR